MAANDSLRPAVVVTGATGGIGRAIVDALCRDGRYTVIGACRTPARLAEDMNRFNAADEEPRLLGAPLDLATVAGAIDDAQALKSLLNIRGLTLHAIINNAGTMPVDRLSVSPDGMEMTLQVNCISTLAFTIALLPALADGGAIVMTSSIMRKLPALDDNFDTKALKADNFIKRFNNYGRSKRLLTHAARYLADTLAERGIRVNCADPGVVDSGIIHLGFPIVDRLADLIARPVMSSPAKGAQAALHALDCPSTGIMHTQSSQKPIPPLTPAELSAVEKALHLAQSSNNS